ncbi:MAG: phosphatidylglycerophosphatase A [Gammaproteobacteria bacterium]
MPAPSALQLLRKPLWLLAFGFGSGLSPKAPGTAGTLLAAIIYLPLSALPWMAYLAVVLASLVAGIWICGRVSAELGVHDHGGIVWDEFVGFWITMFLAPSSLMWLLIGFVLFRALDILKPWPISRLDREVTGGLGIMLDDVLAGIMAALCIQALLVLGVPGT